MAGGEEIILDPNQCIPKRNQKYASECTEVFLSNRGGTAVSNHFDRFTNLEVLWLNGNQLPRLDNLEENKRIREIYIQDNRIVSLACVRNFTFLRVLLASNNQIRNLEKQLTLLSRSAFLKKLDLFDNPVAEEPDYRMRLIYFVPQVEILDRHTVKLEERNKAAEVVPNLDKAFGPGAEKVQRKVQTHSLVETDCFRRDAAIKKRREEAEEALYQSYAQVQAASSSTADIKATDIFKLAPCHGALGGEHWDYKPEGRVNRELSRPSPWEKHEMRRHIESLASRCSADFAAAPPQQCKAGHALKEECCKALSTCGACNNTSNGGKQFAKGTMMWRCEPCQFQICQNCKEKPKLSKTDVDALTELLATEGLEDVGRVLSDARPLRMPGPGKDLARTASRGGTKKKIKDLSEKKHPLDELLQDSEAKMHVTKVADWLLSLEWPRHHDGSLDEKINKCYREAQRGELASRVASCANMAAAQEAMQGWNSAALRLEGSKTLKQELNSIARDPRATKATYTVTVDTTAEMLGLAGDAGRAGTLSVKSIDKDGLVAAWNSAHPTMKVGVGDQVVEVNGVTGSSKKISDELKKSQSLTLTLRRSASLSEARKTRAERGPPKRQDVFHQTFLQPRRAVDEATGKVVLTVAHETRPLTIGG